VDVVYHLPKTRALGPGELQVAVAAVSVLITDHWSAHSDRLTEYTCPLVVRGVSCDSRKHYSALQYERLTVDAGPYKSRPWAEAGGWFCCALHAP
jgi:hypothetical protein